jgi:Trk K+ transport system NAD-binding subunit
MNHAVVIGSDPDGLGEALEAQGVTVSRATGTADRESLVDAGIEDTDALVVTDVGLATSIPVARELNEGFRVVVYSRDSIPEFARASAGLVVDPDLLDVETVAKELTAPN